VAAIQQQDQSRTPGLIGSSELAVGALGEFVVFHGAQYDRVAHAHDYTLYSDVTGH
jgi:hypothetical protein